MRVLGLIVAPLERNAERAGKAVAEVMRRARLKRLSVMHHRFNRVGRFRPGKLLLFCLAAFRHRDSEGIFTELGVNAEHPLCLLHRLLLRLMHGMAFLPPEFTGAQKRTRRLFPPDNGAPLIVKLGQVAV